MTKPIYINPIGVIRSGHAQAAGTPIQPSAAIGHDGRVEVDPAWADGLLDLEGFERVWLLYWFDRAAGPHARVTPYRDTREHGIFATRMPPRPIPIGISAVRLLRVEGRVAHVAEIDILDGSPLLDIKPYVPAYDSWPGVRCGWLDDPGVVRGDLRADGRYQAAAPSVIPLDAG